MNLPDEYPKVARGTVLLSKDQRPNGRPESEIESPKTTREVMGFLVDEEVARVV